MSADNLREESPADCVNILDENRLRELKPLDDYGLTPELIQEGYVDVTPDNDGGVLKLVLQPGVGTDLPAADDHVSIHYVASLKNGKQYDDSRKRARPFTFVVGKGMRMSALCQKRYDRPSKCAVKMKED